MAFKQLDKLIGSTVLNKSATQIVLFRHGETNGNKTGQLAGWTDQRLTPRGREQANSLYQSLYAYRGQFGGTHSSDLLRARETCRIALGFSESGVTMDKRLREIHFGDLEGMHFSSLDKKQQNELKNRDYRAPNGESWQDVVDRAALYFRENCKTDGTHLCFSHGGLISTLLHDLGLRDMNLPNCSAIAFQIDKQSGMAKSLMWYWLYPTQEEITI